MSLGVLYVVGWLIAYVIAAAAFTTADDFRPDRFSEWAYVAIMGFFVAIIWPVSAALAALALVTRWAYGKATK